MTDVALQLTRVGKRFPAALAIRAVSLTLRAGELCGLIGACGAGKTTLLRLALGLLAPDTGTVRAASRIGYLPQARGLYPRMKLLEQLVYLGELHGMQVNAAHSSAERWIDRFGLRALRGQELQDIEAGQLRRVALAAALVHDPVVLLLDQPFADLDPLSAEVLGNVLRERTAAGVAVLFTDTALAEAEQLCNRICILHNGELVADDSVAQLRAGAARTVIVDAPQAEQGWTRQLPGVQVASAQGTRLVLELAPDVDDQAVLAAAQATGSVREFSLREGSLAHRFETQLNPAARQPMVPSW